MQTTGAFIEDSFSTNHQYFQKVINNGTVSVHLSIYFFIYVSRRVYPCEMRCSRLKMKIFLLRELIIFSKRCKSAGFIYSKKPKIS